MFKNWESIVSETTKEKYKDKEVDPFVFVWTKFFEKPGFNKLAIQYSQRYQQAGFEKACIFFQMLLEKESYAENVWQTVKHQIDTMK